MKTLILTLAASSLCATLAGAQTTVPLTGTVTIPSQTVVVSIPAQTSGGLSIPTQTIMVTLPSATASVSITATTGGGGGNPVNGACGSANGTTVSAAPSTNLCSAGTPSVVSGSGPFTWSCTGSNGGTTASCSANLTSSGGASPSGTTVPPATSITDASGNVWTISGGVVYVNGGGTFYLGSTIQILYYNGNIYQQNALGGGNWYKWSGTTWTYIGSDPRTSTSGGGGGTGTTGTLTGDTNRPANSTFVQGEPITLAFTVVGDSSPTLNLVITDENGATRTTASVPITNGTATYTASSASLGYYQVNATLSDGVTPAMLGTRPAGYITYAVVPDPATRASYGDTLSRFGMQGGFSAAQGAVIPYLGVRYVIGTPGWSSLEPNNAGELAAMIAQGQYPPTTPYLDAVTYNGQPWATYEIALVAQGGMPPWAGPLAGTAGTQCTAFGALNPAGVAGLPVFATALGTEFPIVYPHQTKHFYQITSEPEVPWCYGGSPAQLTQFFQLTYSQLHAADPTAQVMGPTLFYYGDETEIAGMYAAGFGSVIDAFSIHPYAPWPFETSPFLADLRAEMAQANAAAGRTIPFFGTEHGLVSGVLGVLNQALGNIREEIALLGEGFIHDYSFYIADFWVNSPTETAYTFGFYYNLDPNIPQGTDKVGPKPAVPAYAALTYLLDGSTTSGVIAGLTGTQMGYRFTRSGSNILALWDYSTTSTFALTVPSGQSVQMYSWMGNATTLVSTGKLSLNLGAAPIYVVGTGI